MAQADTDNNGQNGKSAAEWPTPAMVAHSLRCGAPDHGVLVVDLHGDVRFWNAGCAKLFGYEPDEMLGAPVKRLYPLEASAQGEPEQDLRSGAQLERLINELLDVSRVARGELNIERQAINLSETIQHAVEASRPIIELREHQLHVSLPRGPVLASGDQMRLSQAILNLLNNAAKYTPARGEIWLELTTHEGRAIIKVRDTGVGIRPEMQHRIFDLFAQDRETLSLANGGLGVGLALVRRVIDMHGGRVDVQSEGRDHGSEFVIQLPLQAAVAEEPSAAANGDKSIESSLPRRKILIADDNVDAAWALDALLQAMGQDTHVVHDGLAALEAARQNRPDLVLLDIGMPKLNGYEVATRLRASEEGKNLVLVAVTGWGLDADKRRAHEVGFDFHFVKPASVLALKRLIVNPVRPGSAAGP